jgi:branched-chain amino acid transport system permease protein
MSTETRSVGGVSWKVIVVAVAGVLAAAAPQFVGTFWTSVGINILAIGLFAMSFNLLFGYTGLLSFGHQAFTGVAAYTVALTISGSGVSAIPTVDSFLMALVAAVVVAIIASALIGALCVQRDGIFFAMLTLALSMLLYETAFTWQNLTGGANGTTLLAPTVNLGPLSFNPLEPGQYYYFVFAVVVVALVLLWRLVNSPFGETLIAIRENNERAEFVGINVKLYQWLAFVISGAFAGIAGALISVQAFNVAPGVLHWSTGAEAVVATLIGGPTSFFGPMLGAAVFIMLEEILTGFISDGWQVILGAVLVPMVLFFPGGILGALFDEDSSIALLRDRLGLGGEEESPGPEAPGADPAGTPPGTDSTPPTEEDD